MRAGKDDFARALGIYRAGDPVEASKLCRAILAGQPNCFDAAHLLGAIQLSCGHASEAERWFQKALAIDPHASDAWTNLATAQRLQEKNDQALSSLDRAIALNSDSAPARRSRANLLRTAGRNSDALVDYDRALALQPSHAETHYNRGGALDALGRSGEAIGAYENAIAIKPTFAEALLNLGLAYSELGHFEDALGALDRALVQQPRNGDAHVNRGNVLRDLERPRDALAEYEHAIALKPDHAVAFNNRGIALRDLRRFDEAIASFGCALALRPDYAEAEWNRGITHLLMGHWLERWDGYEARFRKKKDAIHRPQVSAPEWRGEPLGGKTLFLFGEQGLGDAMQFIRFVPPLVAQGASVTLQVHRNMHRILGTAVRGVEWVSTTPRDRSFDHQLALMSLPRALGITPSNVPNANPYLAAEPARIERWRSRIGTGGFKIGICWQGNPAGSIDRGRSIPLREFAPLASIRGIRLISLQKNYGLDQIERLVSEVPVETLDNFDEGPDAFLDAAAAMACLDLIVTSDTSIAHLAGALGHRVFIALKYVPDWRWLSEGALSPWYPTARLFRQKAPGQWAPAFLEIAEAISARASNRERVLLHGPR